MKGIFAPNARQRNQGSSDMSVERWARRMSDKYDDWRWGGGDDELETAENITLVPDNGGMFNMGDEEVALPEGDCSGGGCAALDNETGEAGADRYKPTNVFDAIANFAAAQRGLRMDANQGLHRFFKRNSNIRRIGRGGKFANMPLMQLAAQFFDYRNQKLKSRGEANKNY